MPSFKITAKYFLLLYLAVSIFVLTIKEVKIFKEKSNKITNNSISTQTQIMDEKPIKLQVYYFHGDFRCESCITIENYTKEVIKNFYTMEIKRGLIDFNIINIDQPENEHFQTEYALVSQSVILSLRNKKEKELDWKNLEAVWQYYINKDKFFEYLKSNIDAYLKEIKENGI